MDYRVGSNTILNVIVYRDYVENLGTVRAILCERELEWCEDELLYQEWAGVVKDGAVLIGSALES